MKFIKKILKKKKKKVKKKIPTKIVKLVLVEDIMSRNPISIEINSQISRAIEMLEKYKIGSIIVTKNNYPVGIISEEDLLSYISSFDLEKEKLDNLLKNPVSAAMRKIHIFLEKSTPLKKAIKLMNAYELDQIPVIENRKLVGSLLRENVLEFIEKEATKKRIIKSKVIETGIDKLLDLVNTYGEITSKEAAKKIGISTLEIEKWAKILERHNLIDIDFSTIGIIKLKKKN